MTASLHLIKIGDGMAISQNNYQSNDRFTGQELVIYSK